MNGMFMRVVQQGEAFAVQSQKRGEGLLIFENVVLPFSNPIPKNTQLYKIMTTRLNEVVAVSYTHLDVYKRQPSSRIPG